MKLSLITVVYNGEAYLESALQSVASQGFSNLEYILIDGGSKDGTMKIVEKYRSLFSVVISEKDKGLYDAMNKGIGYATGEVVGILNADDFYEAPDILAKVIAEFEQDPELEALYGDLVYAKPDNLEKVVRYYRANKFQAGHLLRGDMPPHPTFFVRRSLYEKWGGFNTRFRVVADFELMLRFLYKGKAKAKYLPLTMVRMRTGGVSDNGIRSKIRVNKEMQAALAANGFHVPLAKIYAKYFTKIWQLIARPSRNQK